MRSAKWAINSYFYYPKISHNGRQLETNTSKPFDYLFAIHNSHKYPIQRLLWPLKSHPTSKLWYDAGFFILAKSDPTMYVFSVNARTPKALEGFDKGAEVPFIIYVNFKDLFGAEHLCHAYLKQQGFDHPSVEKRKLIEDKFLVDQKLIDADPALKEALTSGYSIQIFSAH